MLGSGQVYKLTNVLGGTVVDLSGGDNKSIIGYSDHNGPNQRWKFTHQHQGWTLKSAGSDLFLGIESPAADGVRVVATQQPTFWEIEKDSDDLSVWRFFVQGTQFCLDLSDNGNKTPGTPLEIWGKWHGKNQTWRLHESN